MSYLSDSEEKFSPSLKSPQVGDLVTIKSIPGAEPWRFHFPIKGIVTKCYGYGIYAVEVIVDFYKVTFGVSDRDLA